MVEDDGGVTVYQLTMDGKREPPDLIHYFNPDEPEPVVQQRQVPLYEQPRLPGMEQLPRDK